MYIVVVSQCLKIEKSGARNSAVFHFNGAFDGNIIDKIVAEYHPKKHHIIKGEEYIVYMRVRECKSSVLVGKIDRVVCLDEITAQI